MERFQVSAKPLSHGQDLKQNIRADRLGDPDIGIDYCSGTYSGKTGCQASAASKKKSSPRGSGKTRGSNSFVDGPLLLVVKYSPCRPAREDDIPRVTMNRRGLLQNSAVMAAIAVLGIKPDQVHSAEGDSPECRMVCGMALTGVTSINEIDRRIGSPASSSELCSLRDLVRSSTRLSRLDCHRARTAVGYRSC